MIIPVEIDNQELLVRFVFSDDFKKGNLSKEKIKDGEVFIDTRGLGVSLQRGNYATTNFCVSAAQSIPKKVFVGFILFLKQNYLDACALMLQERGAFKSELKFTPLDVSGSYLEIITDIDSENEGNPSHADIIYIDPELMMKPEEQTPNVALRLFSKKLCAKSKLFLKEDDEKKLEENLLTLFEKKSEAFQLLDK